MINSVDQDGDGLVDFNDFQLMMQHDNLVCWSRSWKAGEEDCGSLVCEGSKSSASVQ
jgi:hypothetical protein